MEEREIWEKVKKLVQDVSGNEELYVDTETKLIEDCGFDSVAVMELLAGIETVFGVDFTDLEDFGDRFNNCGDLYEGIVTLCIE